MFIFFISNLPEDSIYNSELCMVKILIVETFHPVIILHIIIGGSQMNAFAYQYAEVAITTQNLGPFINDLMMEVCHWIQSKLQQLFGQSLEH